MIFLSVDQFLFDFDSFGLPWWLLLTCMACLFWMLLVAFVVYQVTLATFTAYVTSGGVLSADKAFVSLSLFNILRFPINMLPMVVTYLVTVSA